MRLKVHTPSEQIFAQAERQLDNYGVAIYNASVKRLTFSTGEIPALLQTQLAQLGCRIGEDTQYDLEESN